MPPSEDPSKRQGQNNLWQYVPDPTRTVVYILFAVAVCAAAQWIPQLAGQMEQGDLQQQIHDFRAQKQIEYDQWRQQNPQQAREAEERWAHAVRQAEQEADAELKLAHPHIPLPASDESTTPPCLN